MEQYQTINEENQYQYITKEPVSLFVYLVSSLIIGMLSASYIYGANYIVVAVGVVCAIGYIIGSLRTGISIPTEILLFMAFIFWCIISGFSATNSTLYYESLFTLMQLWVLCIIIASCIKNLASVKVLFIATLIGIVIVAMSAILSGQYKVAEESGKRIAGLAGNANAFAMLMVYAILILLYFFQTWRSLISKIIIFSIIPALIILIIYSGSRKGIICMVIVILGWFWFTYSKELLRRPHYFIGGLAILSILAIFIAYQMSGTTLLKRFGNIEQQKYGSSTYIREGLIKEGFHLIEKYPFLGVGLNNFMIHTHYQLYAHNNYIELMADTGIPGVILYYLITIVLLTKLQHIKKFDLRTNEKALVNIAIIYLLMRLAVDFVLVSYYSKSHWLMMAIFIGLAHTLNKKYHTVIYCETYDGYDNTGAINDDAAY